MEATEDKRKSPSELLVECLDDFANSESRDILIIFTNENDETVLKTNGLRTPTVLGLLDIGRDIVKKNLGF